MDKNIVQAVTDRLRSQSLDEITNLQHHKKLDDKDSGTESDEELCTLTKGMDEERAAARSEPPAVTPQTAPIVIVPALHTYRQPVPSASSPTFRDPHRHFQTLGGAGRGLLQPSLLLHHAPQANTTLHTLASTGAANMMSTTRTLHPTASPSTSHDCSDYERCSLDFEPGNSTDAENSVDFEVRGRSDDYDLELVELNMQCTRPGVINGFAGHTLDALDKISDSDAELAELAGLSDDVHTPVQEDEEGHDDVSPPMLTAAAALQHHHDRCGSCGSSTSDDEIRELLCSKPRPVKFSTSPPRGVHRLNKRTISPKVFLASVHASYSMAVPRKRHRYGNHTKPIQRPHLDFEKMQVTKTRILYSVM